MVYTYDRLRHSTSAFGSTNNEHVKVNTPGDSIPQPLPFLQFGMGLDPLGSPSSIPAAPRENTPLSCQPATCLCWPHPDTLIGAPPAPSYHQYDLYVPLTETPSGYASFHGEPQVKAHQPTPVFYFGQDFHADPIYHPLLGQPPAAPNGNYQPPGLRLSMGTYPRVWRPYPRVYALQHARSYTRCLFVSRYPRP